MEEINTFNITSRKGQSIEDRLIELAIKFVKEKSQEKEEDKIRYSLRVEELSFKRGIPTIKLSREYMIWFGRWRTEMYKLFTQREQRSEGFLSFDRGASSVVTHDEKFQKELITYLQQEPHIIDEGINENRKIELNFYKS